MSRKRRLSGGEDEPLSKRINNLHINNSIFHNKSPHCPQMDELGTMVLPGIDLSDIGDSPSDESQSSSSQNAGIHCYYEPDLSPGDNPVYYETNRLLFDLHLARMQRTQPQ